MQAKRLYLLLVAGVTFLWALPKPGEQFNSKVNVSTTPNKGKPLTMELLFQQKIKSVEKKNQSFVVEITTKNSQQLPPKQPVPPPLITLQSDKYGKATVVGEIQGTSSFPQRESKTTAKGEGVFCILPTDNRVLQGKLVVDIETQCCAYTPEQKKVFLDSKSRTLVETDKL